MPKLRWKLTSSIQSLRSFIEKIVIPQNLPNLRQIHHIAVMQAVIVDLIFIKKCLRESRVTVPIDVFKLVLAQNHPNRVNLTTPDGARDDRAILVTLHKRRPLTTLEHVAEDFLETVVGGPVENTQVEPLVLIQILLSNALAEDDLLVAVVSCLVIDVLGVWPHSPHLHILDWNYLGVLAGRPCWDDIV